MCLAVPGKLASLEQIGESRVGKVDFGGIRRSVFLDFVPDAAPGDYLMVHVGFAISKVDEQEAEANYQLLEKLGLLDEPGSAE